MSVRFPLLAVAVTALLGVAAPAQANLGSPFGSVAQTEQGAPAALKHAQPDYQLNGHAKLGRAGLELTPAARLKVGSAFYTQKFGPLKGTIRTATFTGSIRGRTGGNGLTMILADPARGAKPSSLGYFDRGLGFGRIPGYAIAFSTTPNNTQTKGGFLGISDGVARGPSWRPGQERPHLGLNWVNASEQTYPWKDLNYKITVKVTNGTSIEAQAVVWHPRYKRAPFTLYASADGLTLPNEVLVGFSAATGFDRTSRHLITDVSGSTSSYEPPVGKGVKLKINVRDSPKGPEREYNVDCGLDNANSWPCPSALRLKASDFAPPAGLQGCSLIWAGPEVATITGTVYGTPVSATVTKSGGCELARWNKLVKPFIPIK